MLHLMKSISDRTETPKYFELLRELEIKHRHCAAEGALWFCKYCVFCKNYELVFHIVTLEVRTLQSFPSQRR